MQHASASLDPHRHADALFAAFLRSDPAFDGLFFVGVRTTGVFCRLTCRARKAKRENVEFFRSTDEAVHAGFRPCLRCRPTQPRSEHGAVEALRAHVEADPGRRWTADDLAAMGHDPSTVRRAFRRIYGITFAQFARQARLGHGLAEMHKGRLVITAQHEAGYASSSGFREAVTRLVGEAPRRTVGRPFLATQWIDTPIGAMLSVADDDGVHLLEFADRTALPSELERLRTHVGPLGFHPHRWLETLATQLEAYFAGTRTRFDVPLVQRGSAFERDVWTALREIPIGTTTTYGQLARQLGRPTAARAVARANGANTLAILVPCHRVIGADGSMVGYSGKVWRKQWLLEHERRLSDGRHDSR